MMAPSVTLWAPNGAAPRLMAACQVNDGVVQTNSVQAHCTWPRRSRSRLLAAARPTTSTASTAKRGAQRLPSR
ncbi:Uncharacterised protein [Bordetella pertussis]|nr:Uncharacterised protein [Bordetella pertussis]